MIKPIRQWGCIATHLKLLVGSKLKQSPCGGMWWAFVSRSKKQAGIGRQWVVMKRSAILVVDCSTQASPKRCVLLRLNTSLLDGGCQLILFLRSINQFFNQSGCQSNHQSISQSTNQQSFNQSTSQSVSQAINQLINQSINQSINQPILVIQSNDQSIGQSVRQSFSQSITQAIKQASALYWPFYTEKAYRSSWPRKADKKGLCLPVVIHANNTQDWFFFIDFRTRVEGRAGQADKPVLQLCWQSWPFWLEGATEKASASAQTGDCWASNSCCLAESWHAAAHSHSVNINTISKHHMQLLQIQLLHNSMPGYLWWS